MWVHIDCDNFFCSCERIFRPELEKRAIVVLSNNDGCVVARSREAKNMGIPMGIPYYQMKEQFGDRDVTAFSSNYKLYGDMSARVMSLLRENSPYFYQYSIDEAFIYFPDSNDSFLKVWGEEMSKKVLKWTGLPVSFGIAPTKTLAKVAARYSKKFAGYHKCCMIANDAQRVKALQLLPVNDVWGIGRRIARKLIYSGVNTAYDFTCKSRTWIKSRFHVPGERTWLELLGNDVLGTEDMNGTVKKSIVTSRSFPQMITSKDELRVHISNYASRCALKLRRQNSVCSLLTVFIQSNFFREDLPQYSPSGLYSFTTPVSSTPELVGAARKVLEQIYKKGIHYKRGGVMVSEISNASAIQPDLFEFDPVRNRKYREVSAVIDNINGKLGADTVILAAQQYDMKSESGKNVTFSHAIRRGMLSPDYSTSCNAFLVK